MAVELERAGLPTAMVSALAPVAVELGANRVVSGVRIPHPCGDPGLDPARDLALRQSIVAAAVGALGTAIPRSTIFERAGIV